MTTITPRSALTPTERAERAVTGTELQEQIVDLAVLLGYDWLHVGALRTKHGWRTPTRGTLSAWPDLTLVRGSRLIFAEIKRELEWLRDDQTDVLAILRRAAECYVWRPSDLRDPIGDSVIGRILR